MAVNSRSLPPLFLAGFSSFEVRGNQLKRCLSFRETFDERGKSFVKHSASRMLGALRELITE